MLKRQVFTLDWPCEVETLCLHHEANKKTLLPKNVNCTCVQNWAHVFFWNIPQVPSHVW